MHKREQLSGYCKTFGVDTRLASVDAVLDSTEEVAPLQHLQASVCLSVMVQRDDAAEAFLRLQ
eukprot:CAMPEP_0175878142 /NCGR_PEP_ID=MMETSP0107_2-20121207/41004_1 /TAXON_ID=195067 ORGANISM="Goniomonas pacifica, Strain CCMP1869" /NCGR_SAMPLE_ID=MMETSP0107_2 /ASSEMBLY_ACC=CAM_ASM_000203 /LENGTH=62 /DNA_ID=CAMNT_0017197555 /DNA_START=198 /DNA_END=386 /DNA_ORIENTATION=+